MKKMTSKQNFIFLVTLLGSVILFSFRESDHGKKSLNHNNLFYSSRHTTIGNNLDTGGRTVSLDSAQRCINRFETVMQNHGFSDKAGQKVNIHITRTSMITTGEVFQGKGLLDWLTSTQAQYSAAGKTLMTFAGSNGTARMAWTSGFTETPESGLIVSDYMGARIVEFDAQGKVLHELKNIPWAVTSIALLH